MATTLPNLRACLRHLCAQASPDLVPGILRLLIRLMTNVKGSDPKHHRISLSNPALFERLTKYEGAVDTLEACGWEFSDSVDEAKCDDVWMSFPMESPDICVDDVLNEIDDQGLEIIGTSPPVPSKNLLPSQNPAAPSAAPIGRAPTPSTKPTPSTATSQSSSTAIRRRPPPDHLQPASKLRRAQLADLHEQRMRSGGMVATTTAGHVRRGVITNPESLRQLKEIRQQRHRKYQQNRKKQVGTIHDFAAADNEEEKRIARIGRYAQRDRRRADDFNLKRIGELALKYTNEFRATRGRKALLWHQYLADIGADHSKDMADGKVSFSHVGFKERVAQYPMRSSTAAENLARVCGPDAAKAAVQGWIHSPGHCKNLLSATKWCGIGIVPCGSQYMLTQLFG